VVIFFVIIAAVLSSKLIASTQDFSKAALVVGGIAFAIATFIDTNIGLAAILLSMLLSPELEAGAAGRHAVVIRAEDLLLIIVSITWLAKMAIEKRPLIKNSPLNAPIAIYTAILAFSTLRGMLMGKVVPISGFFYVLKIVEYFVLYFIVLNQITTIKQVKTFLVILLFVSLIVGIYGNTHIGKEARISAPFEGEGEPNTLGGYLLFILSLLGGLIYYYRDRRIILVGIFLFLVPTFIFTLSRASYLGMFASLGIAIVILKDYRITALVLAMFLAFVVLVAVGPPQIRDRVIGAFTPEKQQELKSVGALTLGPSPAARIVSWQIAMKDKFPKAPFFGRGVTGAGFLDSQYVLILVETGLIGLAAFFFLLWRIWSVACDSFRKVQLPLFKGIAIGYMVGFVGLLLHAVGSNTFIIIRIAEPFWFLTAIVVKLFSIETGKAAIEDDLAVYPHLP